MKNLVVYHKIRPDHLERLQKAYTAGEVQVCTDPAELERSLKQAEVLITFKLKPEALAQAPHLKWIQALTAGVEDLPLDDIRRRGILLTNGRGIHRIHMSEYAIAALIMLARNFQDMFRNQLQGIWDRKVHQGQIHGAVLGILGLGSIGAEIAHRASLFGMRVLGVKHAPAPVAGVERVYGPAEMPAVFRQSDYVINLLPDTPATRGIVGRDLLACMKPSACFINIGRGKTVDQDALIEALQAGKIRGLVTDVYAEEPLPADSPLWKLKNVILTPHVCGVSDHYTDRAMEIAEHNLVVYTSGEGELRNRVDLDAGY